MKVLLIDNYDSFIYNIAQYIGILRAEPVIWRNDTFSLDDVCQLKPDAIIISPGPGVPVEAGNCIQVIQYFAGALPILGVCLGHQAIGQAFGAKIALAPTVVHGKVSCIEHDGLEIFNRIPNPFYAMRYHSLVVGDLPDCLHRTAWLKEDTKIIMAIRHNNYPIFGVQFHPESILTKDGLTIFVNFLRSIKSSDAS